MFLKIVIVTFLIASIKATNLNCTISEFYEVQEIVKTCNDISVTNLEVPAGKTLEFNLQNGSRVTFEGTVKFDYVPWNGPLVRFKGDQVIVQGTKGSVFDGQGALYWPSISDENAPPRPYLFQIETTGGSIFKNISIINCPNHCVIIASTDLTITNFDIDVSLGEKYGAKNTDGFDVIEGYNIQIENSKIQNQDDCVAVNRGSNMLIRNLHCSGSHGLSVSVGFSYHSYAHNTVHNVTFEDSTVSNSANGIHIKTHTDSYFGEIKNITYRNIKIEGAANYGINVQQDYYKGHTTGHPVNNIPITGLTMTNVTGTMKGSKGMAVAIYCASEGCFDWNWSNVFITGAEIASNCTYKPLGFNYC